MVFARPITGVGYSPDGQLIVSTRPKGPNGTWFADAISGVGTKVGFSVQGGTVVAFDPAGDHIAVSDGFTTKIYPWRQIGPWVTHDGPPEQKGLAGKSPAGLAWSRDGKRLAFLHLFTDGGGALIREIQPNGAQKRLGGPEVRPLAIVWSNDGKLIVTGQADGTVNVWDAETYQERTRIKIMAVGLSPRVGAMAFAPDGKTVFAGVSFRKASVGGDGAAVPMTDTIPNADRVAIIDLQTSKVDLATLKCPTPVRSLACSPDGNTLLVACGIDRGKLKPRMSEEELKDAGGIAVWQWIPSR
jgi:WD40 repeat protein